MPLLTLYSISLWISLRPSFYSSLCLCLPCTLYDPSSPLRPSSPLMPFTFIWPPSPSVASTASSALCPLYSPMSPLRPSIPSMALLYSLLSRTRPSVPSTTLCPLYNPLSPLQPSVPSMGLCPLYGNLAGACSTYCIYGSILLQSA